LENKKKILEKFKTGGNKCKIFQNPNNLVWISKNEIRERTGTIINYRRWKEYREIESLQAALDEKNQDIPILQEIINERRPEVQKLKELSQIYKEAPPGLEEKEKELKTLETKLKKMKTEKKEIKEKIEENNKKLHMRIMKKIDDELPKIEKRLSKTLKEKKNVETLIKILTNQMREMDGEKRRLHRMI